MGVGVCALLNLSCSVHCSVYVQCCRISVYTVYVMPSDFSVHCVYNVIGFQCTLCIQCRRVWFKQSLFTFMKIWTIKIIV